MNNITTERKSSFRHLNDSRDGERKERFSRNSSNYPIDNNSLIATTANKMQSFNHSSKHSMAHQNHRSQDEYESKKNVLLEFEREKNQKLEEALTMKDKIIVELNRELEEANCARKTVEHKFSHNL